MKNSFLILVFLAFVAVSCNNPATDAGRASAPDSTAHTGRHTQSAATQHPGDNKVQTKDAAPAAIHALVSGYLALKNALVADDGKTAAEAGHKLAVVLQGIDKNAIPAAQQKEYGDIAESVRENAEHIGKNATNIAHQREHFAALSKDVYDLVTMFGAPRKLYQDYCPMYADGKGAIWLSETSAIKNPYYGSEMPDCGTLKKEL